LLFPKDRYEGNDKFCIFIKDRPAKLNGVLLGNGCVDSFHLNHIMLFAAVGLLVPFTEVLPVILISILFEGAEHISFKYITKDCKDAWCHRSEDPFLNLLGYFLGSALGAKLQMR
jgi:hypothetical protein